jgi:hypothetical protein
MVTLKADNGVVAGGRVTDWISLGVLATFVPPAGTLDSERLRY